MKLLDISEIAKRSGMPASTLRFYEESPDRITRPARAQAHFRPRRAWTVVVDCARPACGVPARRDRRDARPQPGATARPGTYLRAAGAPGQDQPTTWPPTKCSLTSNPLPPPPPHSSPPDT